MRPHCISVSRRATPEAEHNLLRMNAAGYRQAKDKGSLENAGRSLEYITRLRKRGGYYNGRQ